MATASIPASSATRKRRPSPDLILRTYRQECITAGDRGAANRSAALLGISDDTVRRVVARDEAARKAREETPEELIFTPPDAAYEAERDIINRKHAAQLAARKTTAATHTFMSSTVKRTENTAVDPIDAATTPHDDAAEPRTAELGNTPPEGHANAAAVDDPAPDDFEETGQNRTAAPSVQRVQPRPPAGIVRDYLRHTSTTVQRDGLLLLAWRWVEAHPLIGPFPVPAVVVVLAGLALAVLGVLG